jgi:adenine-specific DNA-methyltransferase
MDEMIDSGEITFSPDGARLIRKTYLADQTGLAPSTVWDDIDETGHNRQAKYELKKLFPGVPTADLFKTPKPERLLHKIIHLASAPGDIVLDCFAGSGTTAAVAHKMGRRWVAVEREAETIERFMQPRLVKVLDGHDPGGVTTLTDWKGGGGFRVVDVAPSMFRADGGRVFLSEWATNGKLAEVTAAQLNFEYEYDPPFCGRLGRSRLAVIDGLVNEDVVRLLVTALADSERLNVCGTAIDPAAKDALRSLRPGSTVRKVPQSILQEYRQSVRGRQSVISAAPVLSAEVPIATR